MMCNLFYEPAGRKELTPFPSPLVARVRVGRWQQRSSTAVRQYGLRGLAGSVVLGDHGIAGSGRLSGCGGYVVAVE